MHRSDPKRAFLVQQQISELGPEDAHRVFQQRLKYRLQFTGRRSDDFENLSAREQLLQGLVPLPDESRDLFFRACRDRTATTHGPGVWRRHLTAAPPTLERRFIPTP